jgi:HPt (histidine-containing phosphotransfer) domain-containing protein
MNRAEGTERDYHDGMLPPLRELYEPDGALELVQTMRDDLARKRRDLLAAIRAGDRVSAGRVAHSLKSEVRIVAADDLGHALEAVEQAFKTGEFDAAVSTLQALIQRCETLFERLCEAAGG